MPARRECCDHCMWYGPVNKDGGMRKHRPATRDDKWGRPNKVQDMTAGHCPGSNKAYARFGNDAQATKDAQTSEQEKPVNATMTTCASHHVPDKRGAHTVELPVPRCESGVTYGVWDELAGGFIYAGDCATEVANWAAEALAGDADNEFFIKAICRDHEDEPHDSCTNCLA
ncbi:hypothetical protein [Streptomyces sp. NPDC057854]|uniref:hypothetical protein n=1 Tax=unclassified Streptomyces TaxID=2593676 RepID=UPI0036903E57